LPGSPLAQPWVVLAGNGVAALIGWRASMPPPPLRHQLVAGDNFGVQPRAVFDALPRLAELRDLANVDETCMQRSDRLRPRHAQRAQYVAHLLRPICG
jgi:hypothetical protein